MNSSILKKMVIVILSLVMVISFSSFAFADGWLSKVKPLEFGTSYDGFAYGNDYEAWQFNVPEDGSIQLYVESESKDLGYIYFEIYAMDDVDHPVAKTHLAEGGIPGAYEPSYSSARGVYFDDETINLSKGDYYIAYKGSTEAFGYTGAFIFSLNYKANQNTSNENGDDADPSEESEDKSSSSDKRDIAFANVEMDFLYEYTGYPITPKLTLTDEEVKLTENTDYILTYSDNIDIGMGVVTIKGIGDYNNEISYEFEIVQKNSLRLAKVTLEYQKTYYTGKAKTPSVTVKYKNKTLKSGRDYSVKYENNKKSGPAYVYVNGKGDYFDSNEDTFVIIPRKPIVKKVYKATVNGKKSIKVSFKRSYSYNEANCYEIRVYNKNKKLIGGKYYYYSGKKNSKTNDYAALSEHARKRVPRMLIAF